MMFLFKVPYKCSQCKNTGVYHTCIDWEDVQLQCKCGYGAVQTQVPLSILEVEHNSNTTNAGYDELDVVVRKGRKVA